jgi:hypothetical protein
MDKDVRVSPGQKKTMRVGRTDRKSLSLLDVETLSGDSNDGVGVLVHAEQNEDLFSVGHLLLPGDVLGLSEDGGELKRLSLQGREEP